MVKNYYIGEYQLVRGGYKFKVWDKQSSIYIDRQYPDGYIPPDPIVLGTWLEKLPPEYPEPENPAPVEQPVVLKAEPPKPLFKPEVKPVV